MKPLKKPAVPIRRSQRGFTLIELIVVLVILGILAAFAIPRFANVNEDARKAALQGLAGSLRSSAALVHGLAMARGVTSGAIKLEGQDVTLENAYPTADAAGIGESVLNLQGFSQNEDAGAGTMTFSTANVPSDATKCDVVYTKAPPGGSAVVKLTIDDCK